MVTSFEFQQTEMYQLNHWAKDEDSVHLKSQWALLTEVAQQGTGLATSGDWTGVFHLSTERLQCRPAHSTLPACLHPDLEGPAKGENVICSPCPSHVCLVSWDCPCMLWTVLGFGDLMGNPPCLEANPNWLVSHPSHTPNSNPLQYESTKRSH
jgi:hypothetical protein